ncbi:hypothetical protein Tco_0581697 [Tanacetum coccineum]
MVVEQSSSGGGAVVLVVVMVWTNRRHLRPLQAAAGRCKLLQAAASCCRPLVVITAKPLRCQMNELHGRKEVDFELRAFKDTAPLNLGAESFSFAIILGFYFTEDKIRIVFDYTVIQIIDEDNASIFVQDCSPRSLEVLAELALMFEAQISLTRLRVAKEVMDETAGVAHAAIASYSSSCTPMYNSRQEGCGLQRKLLINAIHLLVALSIDAEHDIASSYCCYDQRRSPNHASTNIRSGQKLKEKRRPDFRYSSPAKTRLLAAVEATTLTMVLLDDLEGINSVGFSSCNMLRHKHVQVITQVFLKAYEKATTHGQDRMLVVTLARIIRRNRRLMGSSYRMGSRDFVVF